MKALIDSKELAVGAWIRTDGEIARITSLYKHNGELVAEGKLYDDSSDIYASARKERLVERQIKCQHIYPSTTGYRQQDCFQGQCSCVPQRSDSIRAPASERLARTQ